MKNIKKIVRSLPPLFPTQEAGLSTVQLILEKTNIAVFSMCPGGGKTISAIHELCHILKQGGRVLILAHGTNVLQTQWVSVLTKFSIEHSTDINSNAGVIVTIPQAIYSKLPKKLSFDYVVIDEGHEFYYAEMVQKILARLKKDAKQLILTGTPSVFIKEGITPVVVAATEVYKEGRLSDTFFGMTMGCQSIRDEDYNEQQEVKSTFTEKRKDLEASLEETVTTISKRLAKEAGLKERSAKAVFTHLKKTMIATRNIEQATILFKALKKMKIPVVVSTHGEDNKSANISKFLLDPSIQVLIVVRRGILGFDMPEMTCAIDFTGSRNINRIYQLYARVLRTHPKKEKKYFFRVCSANAPEKDVLHMKAALCLANHDFISKFNGVNINDMPIPEEPYPSGEFDDRDRSGRNRNSFFSKETLNDSDLLDQIKSAILTSTYKAQSGAEMTFVRFGDALAHLEGKFFSSVEQKKEALMELALTGKKRPTSGKDDEREETLARALQRYTNPKSKTFDTDFNHTIRELRPDWFLEKIKSHEMKKIIIALAKSGASRPSQRKGKDRTVGKAIQNYTSKGNRAYDASFSTELRSIRPDWFNAPKDRKGILLKLAMQSNSKRPSASSKDDYTRKLGKCLGSYTVATSKSYDPVFDRKLRTLRPDWFDLADKDRKGILLKMAQKGEPRPAGKALDLETRKLGRALQKYTNKNSKRYDSKFTEEITKKCPEWFKKVS